MDVGGSGASTGASFGATTAFPATVEGACGLQTQCACANESYDACVASLGSMPTSVFQCIVVQDCATFCGGGGVGCVEAWATDNAASSAAGHELRMGIIENYPTGGNCSAGQREVLDSYGVFVRCE